VILNGLVVLSGCAGQSVRVGALALSVIDSSTAQSFHVVDQLSAWSPYCHRQYRRWIDRHGGLYAEEEQLLKEHAERRRARGWGNGFEQALYTSRSLARAIDAAIRDRLLPEDDARFEQRLLEHFAHRLAPLVETHARMSDRLRDLLRQEAARLSPLADALARFTRVAAPLRVSVYPIVNPDESASGGGWNGGRLVIEVSPHADPIPTLLHEALHVLLHEQQRAIDSAARSCAHDLDPETLEEGIAYAFSPGLLDGGEARLERQRAQSTDRYLRFTRLTIALRPILRDALARQEPRALDRFLLDACDAWRKLDQSAASSTAR
jgi:hypothetical protein